MSCTCVIKSLRPNYTYQTTTSSGDLIFWTHKELCRNWGVCVCAVYVDRSRHVRVLLVSIWISIMPRIQEGRELISLVETVPCG